MCLATDLMQDPARELVTGEALLGRVDKRVGSQQPVLGVPPAQEGLDAGDSAHAVHGPHRLEVQFQLAFGHRPAQLDHLPLLIEDGPPQPIRPGHRYRPLNSRPSRCRLTPGPSMTVHGARLFG